MKVISIKVIPNAKKNKISDEDGKLKVRVNAPAVGGKANKAVVEVLAGFFEVKKKDIRIIRGEKSREKVIAVNKESDCKS